MAEKPTENIVELTWKCSITLTREEALALSKMAAFSSEIAKFAERNWRSELPTMFGSSIESAFQKFLKMGNLDFEFRQSLQKISGEK